MTALTLPASVALATCLATCLTTCLTTAAAGQSIAPSTAPITAPNTTQHTPPPNAPVVGPAISAAGSTTADRPDAGRAANEANDANEAKGPRASRDAESDAPLVAQPVIRVGKLIRPVTGTAAAGPTRPRLDIVDAGREDVGPLATSLRADPVDQRLPTGFDRVYRVPGSESLLMRGNGALFAVFEESVYRRAGAALPPGTVFHIGMPDLRPTEYGLGHPAGDTEMRSTAAVGRPGAIGSGPLDLRVRPAQPGSSTFSAPGNSRPPSRAAFAPITLESALGIAPRSSASPEQRSSAMAASPEAMAQVEDDLPIGESDEGKLHATPTDPYAHLRLGPARIARAE
jgi:hypothetical protein